jgi:hypothetical protein
MFFRYFTSKTFRVILDERYYENSKSLKLVQDIFLMPINAVYWLKTRTSYTTNSWIFTTNHKRISVNYFNFVLVAGTAGMGLATVIRLEFAYPGVGILAGDSLQYLSVATAHGVIMVFYMIMPAIFGAFGNFLLPTQLGVHDVAFPRLNSAAFWFLPGGLIMLCQLVCTDRRYARMNCFNIRELQGILKRRFFTDMVNSHDHRDILNSSMIVAKFKLNSEANVSLDNTLFYNWGIFKGNHLKSTNFNNNKLSEGRSFLSHGDTYLTGFFKPVSGLFFLPSHLNNVFSFLTFHVLTVCNIFFNVHLLFFSMFSFFLSFFNGSLIISLFNTFAFNLATLRTPNLGFS